MSGVRKRLRQFATGWIILVGLFAVVLYELSPPEVGAGLGARFGDDRCKLQDEDHNTPSERLYLPLLERTFHSDPSPHVHMVTISSEMEPLSVMNNTCEGRRFLTALVKQLDADEARVIVIDNTSRLDPAPTKQ